MCRFLYKTVSTKEARDLENLKGSLFFPFWFNHLGSLTKDTLQTQGLVHICFLFLLREWIVKAQGPDLTDVQGAMPVCGCIWVPLSSCSDSVQGIDTSIACFQTLTSSHLTILQLYCPVSKSWNTNIMFKGVLNLCLVCC